MANKRRHRGITRNGIACTDDDCWCHDPAQNPLHEANQIEERDRKLFAGLRPAPKYMRLAFELAEAVRKDEANGGCDISAGMFGPNVSKWLQEVACGE